MKQSASFCLTYTLTNATATATATASATTTSFLPVKSVTDHAKDIIH
jgi:hypothetical protein